MGSHSDHKIVLLLYSHYPIVNPQASPFRSSARDGGHYVVLRGDPANDGAMAVSDSANGLRTMFVSGKVIFSDKAGSGLWLKLHPESLPAYSMVATDVITIELTPKPVSGD